MKIRLVPVLGGACVAAGVFLFLVLPSCAVGRTPAGKVVYGADLGALAEGTNEAIGSLFDSLGGWLGVAGLGTPVAVLSGALLRGWAKAKASAAAATAAKSAADDAYDDGAAAAHAARDKADAEYLDGLSRSNMAAGAGAGADVQRPVPPTPEVSA